MKKYYIHNGKGQEGPFNLEDLKTKNLSNDTSVWYEGLAEWTTVEKIQELNALIKNTTPPAFNLKQPAPLNTKEKSSRPSKNKSYTKSIVIGVVVIIGGYFIINNLNGSGAAASYYETVMTVEEIEKADPVKFLNATGTYSENFWGDKLTINGEVTNNATVANFKDVVIRVTFFSKTKTVITTEDYVIYDFFPAHKTKKFELKVKNYKATNALGWEPIGAIPY